MRVQTAEAPLRALQKPPVVPAETLRPDVRQREDEGGGRLLACARCRAAVTTTAARIERTGAHEHSFVNPHGIRYQIGCFATAEGCIRIGEPSDYWTWFPGYRWQIEICAGCHEHLGWLFRGDADRFHGFILDRLVEVDEEPA